MLSISYAFISFELCVNEKHIAYLFVLCVDYKHKFFSCWLLQVVWCSTPVYSNLFQSNFQLNNMSK